MAVKVHLVQENKTKQPKHHNKLQYAFIKPHAITSLLHLAHHLIQDSQQKFQQEP